MRLMVGSEDMLLVCLIDCEVWDACTKQEGEKVERGEMQLKKRILEFIFYFIVIGLIYISSNPIRLRVNLSSIRGPFARVTCNDDRQINAQGEKLQHEPSKAQVLLFYLLWLSTETIFSHSSKQIIMKVSLCALVTLLTVPATSAFTLNPASTTLTSLNAAISGSKGTGEGWLKRPSAPVNSEESARLTLAESLKGSTFQKRLSLLGSTGSIGTQTLEIVDACPDNFVVDTLSAGNNAKLMAEQVMKYQPKLASLATAEAAAELKERLIALGCQNMPEIMFGDDGILAAATWDTADTVVTGIVGAAGLKPTIEAIKLGKDIALANKETLISGGPVINPLVEQYGVNLLPADSEHSAIFQCLQGVPAGGLRRVILTASGGAFRDFSKDELFRLCQEDPRAVQAKATTHPNWDMGAKITLDSATMMNKGLEVRKI